MDIPFVSFLFPPPRDFFFKGGGGGKGLNLEDTGRWFPSRRPPMPPERLEDAHPCLRIVLCKEIVVLFDTTGLLNVPHVYTL